MSKRRLTASGRVGEQIHTLFANPGREMGQLSWTRWSA